MIWLVVAAFFLGAIVGVVIGGIVGYRKGIKEEYKKWRHMRMLSGHG